MDDAGIKKIGWNIFSDHEVEHVEGWVGGLTRDEAENRLQNATAGTYVIRGGDKTSSLSVDQLMLGNHRLIQHYLLVVKKENEGIGEFLILHTSQGWMIYGDEVHLGAYRPFSSLPELLSSLDPMSYRPLQHRNSKVSHEGTKQAG